MKKFILAITLLAGCATPVVDFGYNLNVDDILREHFTDEAYEAVKDIPVVDGFVMDGGAYAAGVNFWSNFASIVTFNGYGRKVIVDLDLLIANAANSLVPSRIFIQRYIIHEYIHHLDDMTRDGEADFIDLDEFADGYIDCYGHLRYHGIYRVVEIQAAKYLMDVFGIGDMAEHVAYTGETIAFQGCPESLGYAFRKILRKYEDLEQ